MPPPERWSFSSIRGFNTCPLRWSLSNNSAVQPKRSCSVASIEGDLLHQLIQAYFERDPSEPFRQRKALLHFISVYPDRHPEDKIAIKALVQRASIQDILISFIKTLEVIRAEGGAEYTFRKRTLANTTVEIGQSQRESGANGVEKWIQVEIAAAVLCGRLDYYIDGVLIDFKSGQAHAWHKEQVAFYCALVYEKFSQLPKSAKIYYSGSDASVEVLVPTEEECDLLLLRYAQMAATASEKLVAGKVEALPGRENCLFCPYKSYCDEYWAVVVPELMQDPELAVVDVAVEGDAKITSNSSYLSVNFTTTYGPVEIIFPHHTHADISDCDLTACRILRARKRRHGDLVSIVLTEQSEVLVIS